MSISWVARFGSTAAISAVLVIAGNALAGADVDGFYSAPAPINSTPGNVIRSEVVSVIVPSLTAVRDGIDARRVLYQSTGARGEPIAVSGTVMTPHSAWHGRGARPLVTYAVGTRGLADRCAPSHALTNGTEIDSVAMGALLDRGFAVAVTDYEGVGAPGAPTYLNRLSQGHTVLDVARAAQRLPNSGISRTGPVAVYGYSQGGAGSAAAVELAPTYAPDLAMVGGVAGAIPSNLATLADRNEGRPFFGALGYIFHGLVGAYPDLGKPLDDALNPQGRDFLRQTADECVVDTLAKHAFGTSPSLTKSGDTFGDILRSPSFAVAANAQSYGAVAPQVPTLLLQSTSDDTVYYAQTHQIAHDWCAEGAVVDFKQYDLPPIAPLADHAVPGVISVPDAVDWLASRFSGLPAPNNCDSVAG